MIEEKDIIQIIYLVSFKYPLIKGKAFISRVNRSLSNMRMCHSLDLSEYIDR
jgi:hypothetical protein